MVLGTVLVSVSIWMGEGAELPFSLPIDDEVFHQNPKGQNNHDGTHEIPKCHYLDSGAKYDVRREGQHSSQQISDGCDDWTPHPQENLNGTFVKRPTKRTDDQGILP